MTDAVIISLVGGAVTIIAGVIGAFAERNKRLVSKLHVEVDGKLKEFIKVTKKLATSQGRAAGVRAELKRSQFIPKPTETHKRARRK